MDLSSIDLASLSPEQLAALDELHALEEANKLARYWVDPPGLGSWGMVPWQRKFHTDPAEKRIVRGGNKVFKTTTLTAETWALMTGTHPFRKLPLPLTVLYVVADLEHSYADDVCMVLRELQPPGVLSARCRWASTDGYRIGGRRALSLANGSRVMFRSGEQADLALAGIRVGLVIVNEPPRKRVWGEITRAAAFDRAPMLVGLTPLPEGAQRRNEDLLWLRDEIRAKGWSEHVVRLDPANLPARKPEDVLEQIANIPEWELAQRRDGAWEGPSPLRRLSNWDGSQLFGGDTWEDLPGVDLKRQLRLILHADHGELPGTQIWLLSAVQGVGRHAVAWTVAEYTSPSRTTVRQDADQVDDMIQGRGLVFDDIDQAVGDSNSAGKSSPMRRVNQEFEQAFRARGARSLRVVSPEKRPGSVRWGTHVLNDALGREAWWVHERCTRLLRSIQRWDGENDEHKHALDGARYGLVKELYVRGGRVSPLIAVV